MENDNRVSGKKDVSFSKGNITTECTIKIDKEGKWYYNGAEIIHRKIFLLFNQLLKRDQEGNYLIEDDKQLCYLDVEDAPFVVTALTYSSSPPSFSIILNDETVETLMPDTIRIGKNNVFYCRVKGGRFEARFSRQSYYQITKYVDFDEKGGEFFLALGSKKYRLIPPVS